MRSFGPIKAMVQPEHTIGVFLSLQIPFFTMTVNIEVIESLSAVSKIIKIYRVIKQFSKFLIQSQYKPDGG